MASGDYDDYEEEARHTPFDRGDHGRVPSSSGEAGFGPTSDFSTMLISKDNRFLGMKLSPDLAQQAQRFFPATLPWLSEMGEKKLVPLVEKIAAQMGSKPHEAKHLAGKVGNYAAYGIILSDQILNIGRNVYDSAQRLNDLNASLKPLAKPDAIPGLAPLSGDNEVVANARAKISGLFWANFKETAVSTISTLPSLMIRWSKQSAKNHELDTLREIEAAKGDPKKLAEILKKEITVGSKAMGMNPRDLQAAKDLMIEEELKAYEAKFKAFEDANKSKVEREVHEMMADLNADNYRTQLGKLKRYGVNVEPVLSEIESSRRWRSRDAGPLSTDEIDPIIQHFKGASDTRRDRDFTTRNRNPVIDPRDREARRAQRAERNNVKDSIDEVLRRQFVRKEGAFNREWLDFSDQHSESRDKRDLTREEEIKQQIAKLEEAQQKAEAEARAAGKGGKEETSTRAAEAAAGLAGGIVGEMFTQAVGGKTRKQYEQPLAYDRILHLRRSLEQAKDEALEQVPGIRIGEGNEKDMGYVQYVHQIFQQHQKDCKRTEIGGRFVEHFEKAGWDDAAIMQLSNEELTPYEYAVKTLAKRIKDGRMDAIALIDLVGNRATKLVHDDGRTFGPRGVGKDDADVKAAMRKVIDEKTAMLHHAKEQTDEKFNENLGGFVFSVEDVKKALVSSDLEKDQRAFIFTLFSDVAGSDEKLCGKLGISNERCKELRKESTEKFSSLLDAAVVTLAETIERDPESLDKNLKLTDKEKQLLASLAQNVKEGKAVTDAVENREELKAVETVVANAAMTLHKAPVPGEDGKPENFWQKLVATARSLKDSAQKAVASAKAAGDDGDREEAPSGKKGRKHGHDAFAGDMSADSPDLDESTQKTLDWASRKGKASNRSHTPYEGDVSADSPDLDDKTRETLDWASKGNGRKGDSYASREYKSESALDREDRRSKMADPYAGIAT